MRRRSTLSELILQKTGLSGRKLADMVGINQSQLSRYEANTHSMPPVAAIRFMKVYMLSNSVEPNLTVPATAKGEAYCKRQLRNKNVRLTMLKRKLSAMQKSYLQASNQLQLFDAIEQTPADELGEEVRLSAGVLRAAALQRLAKNGWLPQKKLLIKIAVLEYETGLYQDLEPINLTPEVPA